MQRSADTQALIFGSGAARPLMPGVMPLSSMTSKSRVHYIGGARIGWLGGATWPFASLTCTADSLRLYVFPFSNYRFRPEQVVAIEAFEGLGSGVRILHKVPAYNNRLIFFWFGSPRTIINNIFEVGFVPRGKDASDERAA
jgi:hypothetical protein